MLQTYSIGVDFLQKWPIRYQLLSEFLKPPLDEKELRQQIAVKDK